MESTTDPDQPPADPPAEGSISIKRPAHTCKSLIKDYDLKWEEPQTTKVKIKQYFRSHCQFNRQCLVDRILNFLPFIKIFQSYKWKSWILLDILSGISVGVIHIPQGMGFALLTSVPPVFGLYSSFFPLLFYFFFGTSKHISMGTMAITSLMIGSLVDREVALLGLPTANNNGSLSTNETDILQNNFVNAKVGLAVSVSLIAGVTQLFMGFFRLGIIATFMSMPFVGSFLLGAATHIITGQMFSVFGLNLKRRSGMFSAPLTYYDVFSHITDTNICAIVTSIICLTFLVVIKEIINEKFKSKIKVPLPAELFVIVFGTVASHYGELNQKYDLRIIGHIPVGIPPPRVPPLINATNYIGDSILVGIISFAIAITMAKLMASKHRYKIDVNQELYAYGICNTVGSFLNCFAGTQAPPRTLVHDSIGGKSQISSLVCCVILLLVLMVIGPLFQSLPVCVLASIIIAALLPLFRQCKDLPNMRRINTSDVIVWIVTYMSVTILDLTYGLFIGIGLSAFLVVIHSHLVTGDSLVNLSGSELYIPSGGLETNNISKRPGVKVFQFNASLFFANVEKCKSQLFEKTINLHDVLITKEQNQNIPETHINGKDSFDTLEYHDAEDVSNHDRDDDPDHIHSIILDCSAISYIDLMGINLIKSLVQEYNEVGIRFVLANCNKAMLAKLRTGGVLKDDEDTKTHRLTFPSIQDAVAAATGKESTQL